MGLYYNYMYLLSVGFLLKILWNPLINSITHKLKTPPSTLLPNLPLSITNHAAYAYREDTNISNSCTSYVKYNDSAAIAPCIRVALVHILTDHVTYSISYPITLLLVLQNRIASLHKVSMHNNDSKIQLSCHHRATTCNMM